MNYEELCMLVPQDKFDTSHINELSRLSKQEFVQLIPLLIFWIADVNWLVANPIINILVQYPIDILPYIKNHLSPYEIDDDLKYNIIMFLVPKLPIAIQQEMIPYIERIVLDSTDIEKQGSIEAAQEYMNSIKL